MNVLAMHRLSDLASSRDAGSPVGRVEGLFVSWW
jgi:hypothetical protein